MVKTCLCSEFKRLEYDPYDIKAVMDSVDFVVFNGPNGGQEIRNIVFLSRRPPSAMLMVTTSIRQAVDKGNYEWKVARIAAIGKVNFE